MRGLIYVSIFRSDACLEEQHCVIITVRNTFYGTTKSEYQTLRSKFVRQPAAMLREFEKNGGEWVEKEIEQYVKGGDSKMTDLESWAKY